MGRFLPKIHNRTRETVEKTIDKHVERNRGFWQMTYPSVIVFWTAYKFPTLFTVSMAAFFVASDTMMFWMYALLHFL